MHCGHLAGQIDPAGNEVLKLQVIDDKQLRLNKAVMYYAREYVSQSAP